MFLSEIVAALAVLATLATVGGVVATGVRRALTAPTPAPQPEPFEVYAGSSKSRAAHHDGQGVR